MNEDSPKALRAFLTHNAEDLDAYYGRALPELQALAEVVTHGRAALEPAAVVELARDCDVIVSHRGTAFPAEVFEQLPDLLAVLRCAVDVSDIDVAAASAHAVLVGQAAKSFIPSTAELALGLLIGLARNIGESVVDYRTGRPDVQRSGSQLAGKTAGIVGFGDIARHLAPMLEAIGMTVVAHDPHAPVEGVRAGTFEEVLSSADVVFPLAAATPSTEGMIDAAALALMRPGALLVNVSRGELLDEEAVADALDSGHLGGLAMDVGRAPDQRPSPALASRPGVVATPHLGGLTPENADAQAMSSVEQVRAIVHGEMPERALNAEHATRLRDWWER